MTVKLFTTKEKSSSVAQHTFIKTALLSSLKAFGILAMTFIFASPVFAVDEHYVDGYTKQNGTYVVPHMQTNSNNTKNDNWSSQGNVNPYTGKDGTKNPDQTAAQGSKKSLY